MVDIVGQPLTQEEIVALGLGEPAATQTSVIGAGTVLTDEEVLSLGLEPIVAPVPIQQPGILQLPGQQTIDETAVSLSRELGVDLGPAPAPVSVQDILNIPKAFTGEERQTPETEAARELFTAGFDPKFTFLDITNSVLNAFGGRFDAKTGAVIELGKQLFAATDEGKVNILKRSNPELTTRRDEKGNLFATLTPGGEEFVVDRPGFSPSNAIRLAADIVLFTPAVRAGTIATVGITSALTDFAIQIGGQLLGSQEELDEFRLLTVGLAGAGGKRLETVFEDLVKNATTIVKNAQFKRELRQTVKLTKLEQRELLVKAGEAFDVPVRTTDIFPPSTGGIVDFGKGVREFIENAPVGTKAQVAVQATKLKEAVKRLGDTELTLVEKEKLFQLNDVLNDRIKQLEVDIITTPSQVQGDNITNLFATTAETQSSDTLDLITQLDTLPPSVIEPIIENINKIRFKALTPKQQQKITNIERSMIEVNQDNITALRTIINSDKNLSTGVKKDIIKILNNDNLSASDMLNINLKIQNDIGALRNIAANPLSAVDKQALDVTQGLISIEKGLAMFDLIDKQSKAIFAFKNSIVDRINKGTINLSNPIDVDIITKEMDDVITGRFNKKRASSNPFEIASHDLTKQILTRNFKEGIVKASTVSNVVSLASPANRIKKLERLITQVETRANTQKQIEELFTKATADVKGISPELPQITSLDDLKNLPPALVRKIASDVTRDLKKQISGPVKLVGESNEQLSARLANETQLEDFIIKLDNINKQSKRIEKTLGRQSEGADFEDIIVTLESFGRIISSSKKRGQGAPVDVFAEFGSKVDLNKVLAAFSRTFERKSTKVSAQTFKNAERNFTNKLRRTINNLPTEQVDAIRQLVINSVFKTNRDLVGNGKKLLQLLDTPASVLFKGKHLGELRGLAKLLDVTIRDKTGGVAALLNSPVAQVFTGASLGGAAFGSVTGATFSAGGVAAFLTIMLSARGLQKKVARDFLIKMSRIKNSKGVDKFANEQLPQVLATIVKTLELSAKTGAAIAEQINTTNDKEDNN